MANKGKHLIENDYTPVTYDPQYILMVNHLKKYFPIKGGLLSQTVGHVKAVDGVTFNLRRGCTMGLVGESGCGKSVTSLSLMQLLQRPQGQIVEGAIRLNLGNDKAYDIAKTPADKMQGLRGNYISMIFQEPMTSLNPVYTIGNQIVEVILLHTKKTKQEAWARARELLELVGINEPDRRLKPVSYTHLTLPTIA